MLIWGFLVKMRYLCLRLWDWDLLLILERLTVGFLVTFQSLVCSCWAGCFTATGDGYSQWGRHPCLYCRSSRHSSDFRSALGALRSLSLWIWVDLNHIIWRGSKFIDFNVFLCQKIAAHLLLLLWVQIMPNLELSIRLKFSCYLLLG